MTSASSSYAAAASRVVESNGQDRVAVDVLARPDPDAADLSEATRRHGSELALALVNAVDTASREEDKVKGLEALAILTMVEAPTETIFADPRILSCLVEALERGETTRVKYAALFALTSLSKSPEIGEAMIARPGFLRLVTKTANSGATTQIKAAAMFVLWGLASFEQN